jgi:hypothetical protein
MQQVLEQLRSMVEGLGGSWRQQPSRLTASVPVDMAEPVVVSGNYEFDVPGFPVSVKIAYNGQALRMCRSVQSGRLTDWFLQQLDGAWMFVGEEKCPFDESGLKKVLSHNGPPPRR